MDRHVVIAGQGRAGSTLFYSMLRRTLDGFSLPGSETRAASVINLCGNTCTKRPFDIFEIPRILDLAEGRKRVDLIVTLRDPRDILVSRHSAVHDDYFYSADNCYYIGPGLAPQRTAPGLIPVHDAIAKVATSGLFPQGIFLLKYEDLVNDPDKVQSHLTRDLGLTFTGSFRDFHKGEVPAALAQALNGIRPVEAPSEPKWRKPEHLPRIIDQFTRFPRLHQIMAALDYEQDTTWFDTLRAAA